jgi:hypothetical protein
MGTGALSWEYNGQVLKFITHLYLVLKLRMNRAIPLVPLYALMVRTGTSLPFTFYSFVIRLISQDWAIVTT